MVQIIIADYDEGYGGIGLMINRTSYKAINFYHRNMIKAAWKKDYIMLFSAAVDYCKKYGISGRCFEIIIVENEEISRYYLRKAREVRDNGRS